MARRTRSTALLRRIPVGAAAAALVLIPFFHLNHPALPDDHEHGAALSAHSECEACKWASANPLVLPTPDRSPVDRAARGPSLPPPPSSSVEIQVPSDGHPPRAPPQAFPA